MTERCSQLPQRCKGSITFTTMCRPSCGAKKVQDGGFFYLPAPTIEDGGVQKKNRGRKNEHPPIFEEDPPSIFEGPPPCPPSPANSV